MFYRAGLSAVNSFQWFDLISNMLSMENHSESLSQIDSSHQNLNDLRQWEVVGGPKINIFKKYLVFERFSAR